MHFHSRESEHNRFLHLLNTSALGYEDILLEPRYSEVLSRKSPSLSLERNGFKFNLPIISSPMDTVTGPNMAFAMWQQGGLGIMHRACSIERQVADVKTYLALVATRRDYAPSDCKIPVAAAVGVGEDYQERIEALVDAGVNILCFDTSHGHNLLMKKALNWTKRHYPSVVLIAGSVATAEGYVFLAREGADIVRVGVGNGSICSTRLNTGFGVPQVRALAKIHQMRTNYNYKKTIKRNVSVIADGGCRYPGDIAKALALGADFVMLGSMLAGTSEAPGDILETPKGTRKAYRGMASEGAQEAFKKACTSIEGISTDIAYKGSVKPLLNSYEMNLKAALSYSGCYNLDEFQTYETGPRVLHTSSLASKESYTHILYE